MTVTPPSAFAATDIVARPTRAAPAIATAEVLANEVISANLRRITVRSPEFTDLRLTGPDEFFGLLMPRPGREYVPVPAFAGGNIRVHVSALPEPMRPDLRWYTIRHFDRLRGTIDFDVATHGIIADRIADDDAHVGPGLRWASTVRPGSAVGVVTASGLWRNAPGRQLLVGDAAAAPSIWSILEFQRSFHPERLADTHVVLVTEGPGDLEPGWANGADAAWAEALGGIHTITAPTARQAAAVTEYLGPARVAGPGHPVPDYVWACGEQALAKGVRNVAVRTWGLDRRNVFFSPYWIAGRPRP